MEQIKYHLYIKSNTLLISDVIMAITLYLLLNKGNVVGTREYIW